MNIRKKAVFNWSGGKDSALALYKVLQQKQFDVVALLTESKINVFFDEEGTFKKCE